MTLVDTFCYGSERIEGHCNSKDKIAFLQLVVKYLESCDMIKVEFERLEVQKEVNLYFKYCKCVQS